MVKEGKSGVVEWQARPVGRPRHLTEVQHLVCIEAYTTQAATCKELAWVYGVSRETMRGYLKGFLRRWRRRDDEKILKARAEGKVIRDIAKELRVSPNTVVQALKEHGHGHGQGTKGSGLDRSAHTGAGSATDRGAAMRAEGDREV